MATTQLSPGATPGRRYATFAGRTEVILIPSQKFTATPCNRAYEAEARGRLYTATPRKRTYTASR